MSVLFFTYRRYLLIAAIFVATIKPVLANSDPYSAVKREELSNGTMLYLAPSSAANTVKVSFHYRFGAAHESESDHGLGHVIAQALLHTPQRANDKAASALIRQSGGKVDVQIHPWETHYDAEINADQAGWLLERFAALLLRRQLTDDLIAQAKRDLLIDVGATNLLWQRLREFTPSTGPLKANFWQREMQWMPPTTASATTWSNLPRLTTAQAQAHYQQHYLPRHLTIVVAGGFAADKMAKQIRDSFGKQRNTKQATAPLAPSPTLTKRPYRFATHGAEHGRIALGIKLDNMTANEEIALTAYLQHYAHRLNTQPQTQTTGFGPTAKADLAIYRRAGYATMDVKTSRGNHADYLTTIRQQMRQEAALGKANRDFYRDMRAYYRRLMTEGPADAATMHAAALYMHHLYSNYRETRTPVQIINDLKLTGLRDTLRKTFAKSWSYQYIEEPPLFSKHEHLVYLGALALLLLHLMKQLLKTSFAHTQIRYVRRLRLAPLSLAKTLAYAGIVAVAAGWAQNLYLDMLVHFAWTHKELLTYYGPLAIYLGIFVPGQLLVLASIPDKLMIVGNSLTLKSKYMYARKVPLNNIVAAESIRPWRLFTRLNFKTKFYHWAVWRKGLLLTCNDGRKFFCAVSDCDQVVSEINEFRKVVKPTFDQSLEVFEAFNESEAA